MDIKVLIRKFILFVIGLFFIALGVSFAVKAGIGISPMRWNEVVGTRAVQSFKEEDPIRLAEDILN